MSGPLHRPTPGDAVKARQERLVSATRYAEENPGLTPEARDRIAAWIQDGGEPPWLMTEQTGGRAYPPQQPEEGPRA